MPKAACANCQFFCRTYRGYAGVEHTFDIREEQRRLALVGDLSWQRDAESLACFKGVWDEGVGLSRSTMATFIAKRRRNGECYFFPFQPGMLLPAAEKLQLLQHSRTENLRKYRLAIYALVVSIIGLLAKILYDHT